MSSDDDEGIKPAIYGSNIKKERIHFVPASKETIVQPVCPTSSLGDKYLAIVLKRRGPSTGSSIEDDNTSGTPRAEVEQSEGVPSCEICRLPLVRGDSLEDRLNDKAHDLSLAHQVCVHHSYPPSHLDRNRPGLKYLSSYGWDLDSRRGLGAAGDGRLAPIKTIPKNDTVGLGTEIPKITKKAIKPVLLDAGKVRKREILERRKRARLQELFYQNEDVDKYLGGGFDHG